MRPTVRSLDCGHECRISEKLFERGYQEQEPRLADLQQLRAFLEFGQQLGQRHLAGFHRLDDGFQFAEGSFEREFRVRDIHSGKDATP